MIFSLVSPLALIIFSVVSLLACVAHKLSGSRQRVPLTFVALVAIVLYCGSEPYGEPVPGSVAFCVWAGSVLQLAFAAIAFWLKDFNKGGLQNGNRHRNH